MLIESSSTYEFIKDLLRNGESLTFTSDAFSHGQGASVSINWLSKETYVRELNEKLSFPIFDFMQTYFVNLDVIWVGDFNMEARLEDDKLVFDTEFTSSNSNYWETYDPIYQRVVIDLRLIISLGR